MLNVREYQVANSVPKGTKLVLCKQLMQNPATNYFPMKVHEQRILAFSFLFLLTKTTASFPEGYGEYMKGMLLTLHNPKNGKAKDKCWLLKQNCMCVCACVCVYIYICEVILSKDISISFSTFSLCVAIYIAVQRKTSVPVVREKKKDFSKEIRQDILYHLASSVQCNSDYLSKSLVNLEM